MCGDPSTANARKISPRTGEVPRAAKHQETRRKRTLMHLSHPPVAKIPAPPAWGMNLHERIGASWPATWAIVTSDEEEHKERSRQQARQRDVQEARVGRSIGGVQTRRNGVKSTERDGCPTQDQLPCPHPRLREAQPPPHHLEPQAYSS